MPETSNTEPEPQDRADARQAWLYAANCRLYEDDPGAAELNIGSEREPRMVSRAAAWRDAYAHYLLVDLDADHERLAAAADVCRHDLRETCTLAFWTEVIRARRAADRSRRWVATAEALNPREMYLLRKVYKVALELCELASGIVEDAGAATDDTARRRLLAGSRHTGTLIALGGLPGVAQHSQETYLEEMRGLDDR